MKVYMGTTTGFEPQLVAPGGHAAARYQTSQRRLPAGSNDSLRSRRLNLAAAIQRVQVTQRLTSQHASSSLQVKGKIQRNHHVAGSALHLDGGRDSASAAYASAAYAQSRASSEHDADMAAFSDATKGRLSGIRAKINMNRRRGCVHAQYAAGEADISQARGMGGKAEAASIYAVLDELLELTAAKDASLLEAGLRRHASIIRTCRGAVGETVLHLCFLFGSPVHKVLATHLVKVFGVELIDAEYSGPEYHGEVAMHIALVKIGRAHV